MSSVSAYAATITGSIDGTATLTATGTPGIFDQHFTGSGDEPVLGAFTIESDSVLDLTSFPAFSISDSDVTQTYANGTLSGSTTGQGIFLGNGTVAVTLDFSITAGTGQFAGDTGLVAIKGLVTRGPNGNEHLLGSYIATLVTPADTPEPSTVALFGGSLSALFFWRRRKLPAANRSERI